MGFLKFLKREKKPDLNELDLPPEPPPLEGLEDKHGIELPEINADDFDMTKFDAADKDATKDLTDNSDYKPIMPETKDYDMPDFSQFSGMEETPNAPAEPEMPSMRQPLAASAPSEQPMPAMLQKEMPESEPQHMQRPRRLFRHERTLERRARGEVYVRVDKFKAALDGISMIRTSFRDSDGALMRLENIKNSKDRSFDKVKISLEDLQKKLIFIDKTLFRGG